MISRPILFSTPTIPRLLDGSKTQTRRLVRLPPAKRTVSRIVPSDAPGLWDAEGNDGRGLVWHSLSCPYGEPGDRLWVREAFAMRSDVEAGTPKAIHYLKYKADSDDLENEWHSYGRWKPSIYMPRWASRIALEVLSVRVERVQEISDADAIAEGIQGYYEWAAYPRRVFANLWDSINSGELESWASNPWVWAITFKRIEQAKAVA